MTPVAVVVISKSGKKAVLATVLKFEEGVAMFLGQQLKLSSRLRSSCIRFERTVLK